MSKKELIEYAEKKREILRKYRSVDDSSSKVHSRLYCPFNVPSEDDVIIDEGGSKILAELVEKFKKFEDKHYKEQIANLFDKNFVQNEIYKFIRKKKFVKNIPQKLLQPSKHKWTILIGLRGIQLKKKVDFKLGVLYPVGITGHKLITAKIRRRFEEVNQSPFIGIKNIEAPSLHYASVVALEVAKSCLSLIPNKYESLSYKEDVRFSGWVIGYNKTIKKWSREWNVPHKALLLNDYDEAVLKDIGTVVKKSSRRNSDFSKRVLDITGMFYSAKSVLHPPAKLLLLVTVLESLLLEESFNQSSEYKRINKLADEEKKDSKGQLYVKVKKGVFFRERLKRYVEKIIKMNNPKTKKALNFLNDLYGHRSEVTHLCKKHKLKDDQVKIVEDISLILIKKVASSSKRTHLAALRDVGIVTGKI